MSSASSKSNNQSYVNNASHLPNLDFFQSYLFRISKESAFPNKVHLHRRLEQAPEEINNFFPKIAHVSKVLLFIKQMSCVSNLII